jgi:glyoxylase-like metal-dependent hydrolase (beta-lactamase superfamily II)
VKPVEIGQVRIENVVEWTGPTRPTWVLPDATKEAVAGHRDWLAPHFMDERGRFLMSIHAFVVRAPGLVVLVDTCVGNDKPRLNPTWTMMQTAFLADLAAAGVAPEAVDLVLCTHLHVDHVGWNTRFVNGKWVPTFPKASYLLAKKELALFGSIDEKATDDFLQVQRRVFADSVQPVFDAGLVKTVEGPMQVCEGVRLIATPGHTPGHCSVIIESKGESAMITGDFIHHPIQFHDPGLVSPFDVDNAAAVATRRRVFGEYADTPTLVIGTHFTGPTAGKLVRDGDGYRLVV